MLIVPVQRIPSSRENAMRPRVNGTLRQPGWTVRPIPDQQSWIVREAFLAHQIRNECLHQGMRECARIEMQDAMCILLRVAMGAWLAATRRPDGG